MHMVEAGGVEPTVRKNDSRRLSERRQWFVLAAPAPAARLRFRQPVKGLRRLTGVGRRTSPLWLHPVPPRGRGRAGWAAL